MRQGEEQSGVERSGNYFLHCLTKYGQVEVVRQDTGAAPATGAEACFKCLASHEVLTVQLSPAHCWR